MSELKSLSDIFQTNKVYEQEGFILDLGSFRVRLSRAGGSNKDFKKAFERHTRDIRAAMRRKQLDDAVGNERLAKVFADSVIRNWETNLGSLKEPKWERGINIDGELLPFTKENVVRALIELPALFDVIKESAEEIENFQDEVTKEEDLGNLQTSSSTT